MRSSSTPSILAATLLVLTSLTWSPLARADEAAPSPSPSSSPSSSPSPAASAPPTPISLGKIPSEAESAFGELRQIEEGASKDKATLESTTSSLASLTTELRARMLEDNRILAGNPSLDLLYRLRTTWQTYSEDLSKAEQELAQRESNLESQITRLSQMNQVWQATLQSAPKADMPAAVLHQVQGVLDEITKSRRAAEADRATVLTLQSDVLLEDARSRGAAGAVARAQSQALKDLFVQDGQPIWTAPSTLTSEWKDQSGESLASQWTATTAFAQRLPLSFILHGACIAVLAVFIEWLRRRVRKLSEANPALQRAVPILDLPISTAFVLSALLIPTLYLQAPRWIQVCLAAIALVPTLLILRRLLQRSLFPILYALIGLFLVGNLRVLTASLPVLARFLFLVQVMGGFLFLVWLLRSGVLAPKLREGGPVAPKLAEGGPVARKLSEGGKLAVAEAGTSKRFSQALRIIAKLGLIFFAVAILANIFGYTNLGTLLGVCYIRSVFFGAMLYVVVRILEGFLIIALQVRPLAALRGVQLHRDMLQRRTCGVLEFLAFLLWLNLMLNFIGLRNPLLARIGEILNANVGIGSLNFSLGRILAFAIAVWASFLFSSP